jgi:hypothetical protein
MQDGFGSSAHAAAPRSGRNRRFTESPIDALVHLVVWRGLCRQIPVWLDVHYLTRLRITALPQGWPTRLGNVGCLGLHPDVIQYLPDTCAVRNERDDSHLPATDWAQEREHFVNAGDQHRPQVMRRTPGRQRLALGSSPGSGLANQYPRPSFDSITVVVNHF